MKDNFYSPSNTFTPSYQPSNSNVFNPHNQNTNTVYIENKGNNALVSFMVFCVTAIVVVVIGLPIALLTVPIWLPIIIWRQVQRNRLEIARIAYATEQIRLERIVSVNRPLGERNRQAQILDQLLSQ